jgi:hypothetical protein
MASGEVLYAVEYRDMGTAIHGLFVYEDMETANFVYGLLENSYEENGESYDILEPDITNGLIDGYSEIDYRDVDWNDHEDAYVYYPSIAELDDDFPTIIVVNPEHQVPDLWF